MPESVELRVRVTGAVRPVEPRTLRVESGTTLRGVLHTLGLPVEGTALWWDGVPVPSDTRVDRAGDLEVVSTFSGG